MKLTEAHAIVAVVAIIAFITLVSILLSQNPSPDNFFWKLIHSVIFR